MDEETTDALVILADRYKAQGIPVTDPEPGDELGWEFISLPDLDQHIHRRPAQGGGYAWLAYGSKHSGSGCAPLVATATTARRREVPAPEDWAEFPP